MLNNRDNEATDPRDDLPEEGCCGGCGSRRDGCCGNAAPRGKLYCHNWLADIPGGLADSDIVEVQFKNTRKGYYRNAAKLDLNTGDIVAVESSPGHDIGQVTLTGKLVELQMRRAGVKPNAEIKRVFRHAKPSDLDKWEEAKAKENDTMIRARKIAADLQLKMKIGDVEYQGDGNKAIFYYIADERVDFRQLIKVLADTFKVRIEMKQIGARQEAGRIGGIGPCGRPLCCASWMSNFVSVGTAAARFQNLSLNPQKLAGQCAKLKCCLNFEIDAYVEAVKQMPPRDAKLETADALWHQFKADIFRQEITYSTDKNIPANLTTISRDRAFEIIELNKAGEKPLSLLPEGTPNPDAKKKVVDLVEQESLTRFDKARKRKKKPKKPQGQPQQGAPDAKPRDDAGANPEGGDKGQKGQPNGQQRKRNNRRNNPGAHREQSGGSTPQPQQPPQPPRTPQQQ